MKIMEYSVVIRTLGTAGEKYQQLLNSLKDQTVLPKKILVYNSNNIISNNQTTTNLKHSNNTISKSIM